jgi:hypothetical protein
VLTFGREPAATKGPLEDVQAVFGDPNGQEFGPHGLAHALLVTKK